MTDYNDGNWHGWNGGVTKPSSIHYKSKIEYLWLDVLTRRGGVSRQAAGYDEKIDTFMDWSNVVKFRVATEYKEPREFTLFEDQDGNLSSWCGSHGVAPRSDMRTILVREVIDD